MVYAVSDVEGWGRCIRELRLHGFHIRDWPDDEAVPTMGCEAAQLPDQGQCCKRVGIADPGY